MIGLVPFTNSCRTLIIARLMMM